MTTGRTGRQEVGSRGRPDAPRGPSTRPSNYVHELFVRPPPEATPAPAGHRHVIVVLISLYAPYQQTHHNVQQSDRRVSRRCRRYRLLGRTIARLDTEAFRVMVSSVAWSLDGRRVSGVAVTRHAVLVIPSIQLRTVDVDGKLDGPTVTVEFPCQVMLNDAAPPSREFLLNRLTPLDNRDNIGVVMRLKQRETLAIVESAIKVDGLDFGVKAVENAKEFSEDTAGGVAILGVRRASRKRGMRWFPASLPSGRGRLCRLRHRSGAAGGNLRRPPPAREAVRRHLTEGVY